MKYAHLYEKMQKEQDRFMPAIQQMIQEGTIPEDLEKAVRGIEQWNKEADVDLGEAEVAAYAPDISLVNAFANAITTYIGMFSTKEREAIHLYCEYAEEMFDKVES